MGAQETPARRPPKKYVNRLKGRSEMRFPNESLFFSFFVRDPSLPLKRMYAAAPFRSIAATGSSSLRDACSRSAISPGVSRRKNRSLRRKCFAFGGLPIHRVFVQPETLFVNLFSVCLIQCVARPPEVQERVLAHGTIRTHDSLS
jgi:hypothetical protein